MSNLPEHGSVWIHHNGGEYRVLCIANKFTQYPEQYPVTVVYRGLSNNKIWAKKLDNFLYSMTPKKEVSKA